MLHYQRYPLIVRRNSWAGRLFVNREREGIFVKSHLARSSRRVVSVAAAGAIALGVTAVCLAGPASAASKTKFSGSVTIGVDSATSGFFGASGVSGNDGITMAVDALNASGGLLGKKVHVLFRNDNASVPTAEANTEGLLETDHVVALFGASTSSTAGVMESLATKYKTPLMIFNGNTVSTVTSTYSPYAFQLQPNTYMEPIGIAQFLAKEPSSKKPDLKYYFITPNYSFGRTEQSSFESSMSKLGVKLDDLGTSYTSIGQTSFTSAISAAAATHPQIIFTTIFGGDTVTFLKEAESYGLLKNTAVFVLTGTTTDLALGKSTPTKNLYLSDRAPFFEVHTAAMTKFVAAYHKKYGVWPSEWAVLGYSAVQSWAQGVEKAKSFGGTKVSKTLAGDTFHTLKGTFTIEACDHQAVVPDYFWASAPQVSSKYGFPLAKTVFISNPKDTLMSCSQAKSLRG